MAVTLFEYTGLALEDQLEARAAAERIRTRMRRTAEDIVEIGRDLIAVKERLGHGRFGDWLQAEFEMSDVTARKFMAVAQRLGGKSKLNSVSPTVLYALASPGTDEEVVTKATEKAAAGETVTLAEVQRLKAALVNARNSAGEAAAAAVDEAEESFAVERAALLTKIEEAQKNADLAAEQKYREKAEQMAERAVTAKRRELGDLNRNVEGQQRKADALKREIEELEGFVTERAAYVHKIKDETAEERHLLDVMERNKGALVELAGAFESRMNDSYSDHFNAQVRGFLRMLDMTRQSVAAAGEKILELEAEVISP